MGKFAIRGRAARGTNPRLVKIIEQAAAASPYDVVIFSGARPGRRRGSQHHGNNAVDIVLVDPRTGQELPNYKTASTYPQYEAFARQARQAQQQLYPEMSNQFRWGGWFDQGGPDLMHFDFGSGGTALGNWETGLNSRGQQVYARQGAGFIKSHTQNNRAPTTRYANLWGREDFDVAASPAGPDRETVRLAQEALRDQGFNVTPSGQLDEATKSALGEFRASPGGMAFAQRYGLPVQPVARERAFAPGAVEAPAVGAVNALAEDRPVSPSRTRGISAPEPLDEEGRPPKPAEWYMWNMLEERWVPPEEWANGAVREALIKRGVISENGSPAAPPQMQAQQRPPVQMRVAPDQPPMLPSLAPQEQAPAVDPARFRQAFIPDPERPIDNWQRLPTIHRNVVGDSPDGSAAARSDREAGTQRNRGTVPAYLGGPGAMNALGMPTGPVPSVPPTTAPLPNTVTGQQDPLAQIMLGQTMPDPFRDYMEAQRAQQMAADRERGIPVMAPRTSVESPPVVDVTSGQSPFPRPNPMPPQMRGRSGTDPLGYRWQHIPQQGGPTMLRVQTPQGRRWQTPLGPPGGAGLYNEFASSFLPVIRGW